MGRWAAAIAMTGLLTWAGASLAAEGPAPGSGFDLMEQAQKAATAHDEVRARKLMEQAAATGEPEALNGLAVFIEQGVGAPSDPARARELWEKAAAAGSKGAKFNLAIRLMGARDPGDQKRAADYLVELAKDPKVEPATRYPLGRMTLFGLGGLTRDLRKGVDLLEKSLEAEPDNPDANWLVARAYENGWGGIERNPSKAYGLFLRSAQQGDRRAQRRVGVALLEGVGTDPDPRKAFDWFLKAANAGEINAMIDVAVMLATGEGGVPKDEPQARTWYQKAAELGAAHGLRGLGLMLYVGQGGPVDQARGQAYVELAVEGGDDLAPRLMEQLKLTPASGDRPAIDRIKANWLASHPKPRPD
jgi:TPR repeat protein